MSNTSTTNHTIANTECTGVFCQRIREMQPYHNAPNYMSCSGDYHIFAKNGNKIYMEVRNVGEIVISFSELQKNKYFKYYYDLSLILANDKHKLIKNESFNKLYDQIYGYTGDREWSFETAYIDQTGLKNFKIIPCGNVCYYKVNPYDLEKIEYSTPQELESFKLKYMNCLERVKTFLHRSESYKNITLEYQVNKMENELEELSTYFKDKKDVVDLVATLNDKYCMNDDIIRIIIHNYLYETC